MSLKIDVTAGTISFDDIEDLHFLSRLANAATSYASESDRADLVREYTAFGRLSRHAVTEIYRNGAAK